MCSHILIGIVVLRAFVVKAANLDDIGYVGDTLVLVPSRYEPSGKKSKLVPRLDMSMPLAELKEAVIANRRATADFLQTNLANRRLKARLERWRFNYGDLDKTVLGKPKLTPQSEWAKTQNTRILNELRLMPNVDIPKPQFPPKLGGASRRLPPTPPPMTSPIGNPMMSVQNEAKQPPKYWSEDLDRVAVDPIKQLREEWVCVADEWTLAARAKMPYWQQRPEEQEWAEWKADAVQAWATADAARAIGPWWGRSARRSSRGMLEGVGDACDKAAVAWEDAADLMVQASTENASWTVEVAAARATATAVRATANGAAAAQAQEIVTAWTAAASEWEKVVEAMEAEEVAATGQRLKKIVSAAQGEVDVMGAADYVVEGLDEGDVDTDKKSNKEENGKPSPPPEVLAQTSFSVISIPAALLFGVFVGTGVTFVVFFFQCQVFHQHDPS